MMTTALLFLVGLGLLLNGADFLVRGASRLAAAAGIAPLVIGLTIVAFGTSAPELAVSIGAALSGQADIALGNVVGSNIFNILFVLGLSAAIAPLTVSRKLIRLDVPIMLVTSMLMAALAWNGTISRLEGGVLVALGLAYTVFQVREGRRETGTGTSLARSETPTRSAFWCFVQIGAGLVMLVLGSRWLVDGAVTLARYFGVGELVIGLTVIAAGTSLPEAAVSVIASIKGERDLAVGNVVGSNIFNILWVLGATSMISSHGIRVPPQALHFDLPVMIGVSLACLPIFFTGLVIARWEGGLFLTYFVIYNFLLFLTATKSPNFPLAQLAIFGFVGPLTLLTLGILGFRARGARRESSLGT